MVSSSVVLLLAAVVCCVAAEQRPTVIWHGMGDSCCNPASMGTIKKAIEETLPGTYVYSVRLGDGTLEDEFMGFFADMNEQMEHVCKTLKKDPKLANGFNAVGFSQGGQFLRGYVERCNDPPVHNLVTFGGQHMGVSEIPGCVDANETLCELMEEALSAGVYLPLIRSLSVQAQYFRSPTELKQYREHNIYLADINNEKDTKNMTYKENLISLNKFVMVMFDKDTTVVPKESEFFGTYANNSLSEIVPMEELELYKEDWIGLKTLNEANKIVKLHTPGRHMQFTLEYFKKEVVKPYLNQTISA